MKFNIRILLIILFVANTAKAEQLSENDILANSLGRLIIEHDQRHSYENGLNPFGSAISYDEFVKIYQSDIQKLKINLRIKYFWSAMWHLSFDGHSMGQFQMLVLKDCGDEFIQKLDEYVAKETELKRDKGKLYLSNKVLLGMKRLASMESGSSE